MELTAYLHEGWAPLIRPAPATRAWMDATPETFAYRCLPLNIANAHGWEVLSPCGFEAVWDGGGESSAVTIRLDPDAAPHRAPVSLFGQGVITFHVDAIFRTPPGWNLWVGGSPNRAKDAIAPLTGIVETDWSPFTFTMNWRFTRPNAPVRFEAMEPFCFLFPLQGAAVEDFEPAFASLDSDPATAERFRAWSQARDEFHARMQREPAKARTDRWQKHYFRGVDVSGEALATDHRTKLKLKAFDRTATPGVPAPPAHEPRAPPSAAAAPAASAAQAHEVAALNLALAKRDWLLEAVERQRALAPGGTGIERRTDLGSQEFLERYYAMGRPVILRGEMDDWPALSRWNPDYLKAKVGPALVERQAGRAGKAGYELEKDLPRREGPFDAFIDSMTGPGDSHDACLTACNSERNRKALAPLADDMGFLDKFLTRDVPAPHGMPSIGPAGTVTPLHHELTNNFIAQLVGRSRLKMLPAAEVGRLYDDGRMFSRIGDLEAPDLNLDLYPRLVGAQLYEVLLEPGEILFMPLAWWHQVRALDFSVTVTYANFRWPNDAYATYPAG